MICLRRIAFRALSVPSPSRSVQPRLLTTLSPFSPITRQQKSFLPLQKRWASQDVTDAEGNENALDGEDSTPKTADAEDHQAVASAIGSAADTVSYDSAAAAESLDASAGAAQEVVAENEAISPLIAGPTGLYAPKPPSKNLYVGNLFFDTQPANLRGLFEGCGKINSVTIVKDARGLSRGFGYVEFDDIESSKKAIELFDMQVFEGRRITVQFSKPREFSEERKPGVQKPFLTNPPSPTLFIGNMAFDMSDRDLNHLFSKINNVTDVRVAIDRRTGQPRGFAHADFVDTESAVKAMGELQGREVNGRTLRLDYSVSNPRQRGPPTANDQSR